MAGIFSRRRHEGDRLGQCENEGNAMLARFINDESGAMIVEYGLLVAIIAGSIIGGSMMVGSSIDENMTDVATAIDEPPV